jgi:cation diffusion facilitator family transporter
MTKYYRIAIRLGWMSIIGNLLFFVLKYWAGVSTGSLAIIADAWHTLSDSIGSLVLIIGMKISAMKPDKEHPFGHGRVEQIASIIIGILLFFVAIEFVKESILKFSNKHETDYSFFAILVTIFSIIGKEIMAQLCFKFAKIFKSTILRADAWHHRTDAISSIIILIGILVGSNYWWIDSLLGLVVALLIAWVSVDILRQNIKPLIGEGIENSLINIVKESADVVANFDTRIHHLHIHRYGKHTEITFHMMFPQNISLYTAHQIATKLEVMLRNNHNLEATIHLEPYM